MKWPFVGRRSFDLATERADQFHEAWIAERGAHEVTRNLLNLLTERFATLSRMGFTFSAPEAPPPVFQKIDPEIKAALDGRFPGNSAHKARILQQIDEWQEAGRENTWIARRIWDGEESVDE